MRLAAARYKRVFLSSSVFEPRVLSRLISKTASFDSLQILLSGVSANLQMLAASFKQVSTSLYTDAQDECQKNAFL